MKKQWYDYLWIVELTYLALGFFNILFAWIGLFFFFIPLIIAVVRGTKGYCNRYCGRGQMVPLWLPGLFLHHVLPDAMEYLSGVCRDTESQAGGHAALDVQAAVELGLPWNAVSARRCAIRFWLLQRHADLHSSGADYHGAVQAAELVCVLSNGYHDTAHLQGKKQNRMMRCLQTAASAGNRSQTASRVRP